MRLSLDGVTVAIDDATLVADATLEIGSGEMVGLVGPNGSGKSSLLRSVYRVLRPQAGLVSLDGDDVWRLPAREAARRAAVVTQESAADFEFTAYEVVMLGRLPHKGPFDRDTPDDRALCTAALDRVGMLDRAGRVYATLSGGEKQRVLIARALAQQSRLLLLDEPTNHLDVRFQFEILALVRGLGITVVAALHDLNLAAAYCDRVAVLARGRIVAEGEPEAVLTPALIADVFGVEAVPIRHPATGRMMLALSHDPQGVADAPPVALPNGRTH